MKPTKARKSRKASVSQPSANDKRNLPDIKLEPMSKGETILSIPPVPPTLNPAILNLPVRPTNPPKSPILYPDGISHHPGLNPAINPGLNPGLLPTSFDPAVYQNHIQHLHLLPDVWSGIANGRPVVANNNCSQFVFNAGTTFLR
jgi:hypothetical protein